MNDNGGNQIKIKNIWQGKRQTPSLLLSASSPFRLSPAFFNGGGKMKLLLTIMFVVIATQAYAMDASWYSRADLIRDGQDKRTHFVMANGKVFNDNDMVCASWDYPLNVWLLVRNKSNGKSVLVKNSDRTARRFKGKRCDLSKGAFARIADCKQGIVQVLVELLE